MPNYIGFSTINSNKPKTTNLPNGLAGTLEMSNKPIVYGKKFRMLDQQLVIQDLINAFNIVKGTKVGQPEYGTTLWSYVFEPNVADIQFAIQNEVRRVCSLDPRIILNSVTTFPQDQGILIEVEIAVNPFNQAELINVFFDSNTNVASLVPISA